MGTGKVCKYVAVIVFIIDLISTISLGSELDSWSVFLYGIIAGAIMCLILYGIGEIIDKLEISNENTDKLCNLMKDYIKLYKNNTVVNNSKDEQAKSDTKSDIVPKKYARKWVCIKCGKLRDISPCPYCGHD